MHRSPAVPPGATTHEPRPRPALFEADPGGDARGLPRLTAAGRWVPDGYPPPGKVLVVARALSGRTWAVSLTRADPVLLSAGHPMEAGGDLDPRTAGSLHLPDGADRDKLGTEIVHALARPLRMAWADPDTLEVRSHVPAFLLVETDGTTLVEIVLSDSLAVPDAPPQDLAGWLATECGWRYERLCGTDPWLVRDEILTSVLDAEPGLVSSRLWTACVLGAPTHVLLDSVTTPGDLVALLPLLRDQAADALDPVSVRAAASAGAATTTGGGA